MSINENIEVVAALLDEVLSKVGGGMMEESDSDSIGLLEQSYDELVYHSHPLPSDADLQFFYDIAATAPSHSPGAHSSQLDFDCSQENLEPPSDLLVSPRSSSIQGSQRSLNLSGVALLPLSGVLVPTNNASPTPEYYEDMSYHSQDSISPPTVAVYNSSDDLSQPSPKKARLDGSLKAIARTCLVDYQEEEEEDQTVPLTFDSSVDLLWKLQKADILPANCPLSSQRPRARAPKIDEVRARKESAVKIDLDIVKKESQVPETVNVEDVQRNEENPSLYSDHSKTTCTDDAGDSGSSAGFRFQKASLLNRPPRLGLSRLNRKGTGLHDVTIISDM